MNVNLAQSPHSRVVSNGTAQSSSSIGQTINPLVEAYFNGTSSKVLPSKAAPLAPQNSSAFTIVPVLYVTAGTVATVAVASTFGAMPASMVATAMIGCQAMYERRDQNDLGTSSSWIGWTLKSAVMLACAQGVDLASAIIRAGGVFVNSFGTVLSLKNEMKASDNQISFSRRLSKTLYESLWPSNTLERLSNVIMIAATTLYTLSNTLLLQTPAIDDASLTIASCGFLAATYRQVKHLFKQAFAEADPKKEKTWASTFWNGRDWVAFNLVHVPYALSITHWSPGVTVLFVASVAVNASVGCLKIVCLRRGTLGN